MIQGITEFLPISSSGHLILLPIFTDWPDQGLIIDVAVHVGTLGAVIAYVASDLWGMLVGLARMLNGRREFGARLAGYLAVGGVPVFAAGFALNHYLPDGFRSLTVIAWATLAFGIVLYVTDRMGMTVRRIEHLGYGDVLIIGCAQVLALVPGTSRAGITMSAGRMLGLERTDAARFSMLLAIPAILGAGVVKGLELYERSDAQLTVDAMAAAALAFVMALLAIAAMMAWLRRATFTPFVLYRVVLGLVLLAVAYGWGL